MISQLLCGVLLLPDNNMKNNKGFIALITVLIVLVVSLLIAINAGLLTISEIKTSLQENLSSRAYYFANLCAEQALIKLRENSSYQGSETINIENGSCTILPIEGSWTIKVFGSASGQIKKIKIVLSQINPKITISSWQEVADF